MNLGIVVTPTIMLVGGVTLLVLIGLQVLLGMRKIKFGRRTMVYHKYVAWAIVAVAVVHAVLALQYLYG